MTKLFILGWYKILPTTFKITIYIPYTYTLKPYTYTLKYFKCLDRSDQNPKFKFLGFNYFRVLGFNYFRCLGF
jgi:hypothetical protein